MENEFESPEAEPVAESEAEPNADPEPPAAADEGPPLPLPPAQPASWPTPASTAAPAGWDPNRPPSGWDPYHTPPVPTQPTGLPAWSSSPSPGWDPIPTEPTYPSAPSAPQPATPASSVPPPPGWNEWPPPQAAGWGTAPPLGAGAQPPGGPQPPAGGGYVFGGNGGPGEPRPRQSRRIVLTGLAAIVLLGAVVGGVIIGRSSSNRSPSQSTASETIPSPANSGAPGTNGKIDVAAIASKVDRAVVDVTSIDATSGEEAAGTGMILTPNGEVLTNNHVIAGGTSISAQINGAGRTYQVRVLGTDTTQDVALVLLEGASGLPTVPIGNSAKLQVGDSVVAIGNALDLKGPLTVSQGIVSALDRSISASDAGTGATENLSGLIQTDAPINPGNSGGPLVDAAGEVIGMDTAAATGSSTQSATDIGFAIPIDEAISIAQQIQQGRGSSTVLIDDKGFIGVEVISISEAQSYGSQLPTPGTSTGAYVAGVLDGTPAVQAGVKQGDVITAVNGSAVSSPTSLSTILTNDRPGQLISVTWVDPSGVHETASLTLTSHPVG